MMATRLDTLGAAMVALSADVDSADGVASAAILEAGQRLQQMHADLVVAVPILILAARQASRRTAGGRAMRDACKRLAGEALA